MPVTFNNFTTGPTISQGNQVRLLGVDASGNDFTIRPEALVNQISNQIKNHPSTPAAWVCFEGTKAPVNTSPLIYSSYNVASVTRLSDFGGPSFYEGFGGHRYRINFQTPLKNGNYAVGVTGTAGLNDPLGDDQHIGIFSKDTNLPGSCIVTTVDMDVRGQIISEGSLLVNVVIFGEKGVPDPTPVPTATPLPTVPPPPPPPPPPPITHGSVGFTFATRSNPWSIGPSTIYNQDAVSKNYTVSWTVTNPNLAHMGAGSYGFTFTVGAKQTVSFQNIMFGWLGANVGRGDVFISGVIRY